METIPNISDEQEELESEYGDGNMYESEEVADAESQPDSEKTDAANTDAAEAENPELVTSDSSQVTENPVEPRPTADATRQGNCGQAPQSLIYTFSGFMPFSLFVCVCSIRKSLSFQMNFFVQTQATRRNKI